MSRVAFVAVLSSACVLGPAVTQAQPAPAPICKALNDEVLRSEWKLSEIPLGAIGDNSAPRETMRSAQTSAELAVIATAFEQMRENRCGPYPFAISRRSFEDGAYQCSKVISDSATASVMNKQPADRAAIHAACDKTQWKRAAP